jgi:hypothetical protein
MSFGLVASILWLLSLMVAIISLWRRTKRR